MFIIRHHFYFLKGFLILISKGAEDPPPHLELTINQFANFRA